MKTTASHTPGPLTVQTIETCRNGYPDWQTYAIRDSRNVCLAVVGEVDRASADNHANAVLWAAAPDLLAALQALSEWGRTHTGPNDPNSPHKLLISAVAAISKATAP